MMRMTESCNLPAPAAQAARLIASEGFLNNVYGQMQAERMQIDITADDGERFEARVLRVVNLKEKAPGFARALVSESMEVVHEHAWNLTATPPTGELKISFANMPGELQAKMTCLDDGDDQCRLQLDGQLEVRVRLIGGRLEKFLSGVVSDRFQDLLAAARDHVESNR